MSFAFVQKTTPSAIDPGGSLAVSFPSLPTVANAVIVVAVTEGTPAISDNQGNTYTILRSLGTGLIITVWATSVVTSAGTFTVTVTNGATHPAIMIFAYEYSGFGGLPAVDTSNSASTGAFGGTSLSAAVTTSTTTLILSLIAGDGGGGGTILNPNFASSGGPTLRDHLDIGTTGLPPPPAVSGAVADDLNIAAGTITPAWTFNNTHNIVNMLVLALRVPFAAGAGYVGTAEEHFIWSRKLTIAEHQAAMQDQPSATNLLLECLMGDSPEKDISGNANSGPVTGTMLVSGHP